jgi:hypothetical protein
MTNRAYAKNNGDGLLCSILWRRTEAYVSSPMSQNKKVQQKCNSSKYLSAFLQAICNQSRHPG